MSGRARFQLRSRVQRLFVGLGLSLLATGANDLSAFDRTRLDHPAVVSSAQLVILLISVGWCLMCFGRRGEHAARIGWGLGVLALFAHIPLAFWIALGWSHEAAVEHVREVGGFGSGIVANYLFALVWAGDVGWWWLSPRSHGQRPRWMAVLVHGFLGFIVLNATVIFGAEERRAFYAIFFALLVIAGAVGWRVVRKRT